MPTSAKSRTKVTDVLAVHDACSVDLCTAGNRAALHFATLQGTVTVRLDTREFVAKCRAPVDHNRNPIPTLEQLTRGREELAAHLETPVEECPRAARFTPAWDYLVAHLTLSISEVAEMHSLPDGSFKSWINRFHCGELRALRIAAGLPQRVQRQSVPGTLPVLKPSGRIL